MGQGYTTLGHILGPGQKAGKAGNLILDEPIIEVSGIFQFYGYLKTQLGFRN